MMFYVVTTGRILTWDDDPPCTVYHHDAWRDAMACAQIFEICETENLPATFFEITTALAFQHFRKSGVEAVSRTLSLLILIGRIRPL